MDTETLQRLLRFLNADGSVPDTCTALVNEAKAEALAEAKARLKELFLQAILQTVLEAPAASTAAASLPASLTAVADVVEAPPVSPREAPASAPPAAAAEAPVALVSPAETVAAGRAGTATSAAKPAAAGPVGADTALAEPEPAAPSAEADVDDRQRLIEEMEAIRRQIAENEARLRNVQASPPPAEKTAEPVAQVAADGAAIAAPSSEESSAAVGEAYYVYGLLPADVVLPAGAEAIAGIAPAHPAIGLACRDIQAVVSQVPLNEFGEEELAERFEDLDWVEDKVRRHQQVLETLMRYGPLVPLRFCTLYRSAERVQALLADNYGYWAELLRMFRGKQEWGVKAYLTAETLAERASEVSPKIQQLKAQIAKRSAGAAYFAKKKFEEAVAEEVERLGDEYAQDSHDRLTACAVQACLNSLQSSEVSGNDAKMLLNGAYLVDEAQWSAFRAELAALEAQYGPFGLTYALTGPWPPYNFIPALEEQDANESGRS